MVGSNMQGSSRTYFFLSLLYEQNYCIVHLIRGGFCDEKTLFQCKGPYTAQYGHAYSRDYLEKVKNPEICYQKSC